jgi:hypothetical protein
MASLLQRLWSSGPLGYVILWLWPCGILLDLQRLQGSQCIAALQHFTIATQQKPRHFPMSVGFDQPHSSAP